MLAQLKQYLAELQQEGVGDRKLTRIVIDVKAGQVNIEFEPEAETDSPSVTRLERYEHNEQAKIADWEAKFATWVSRHHGRIGEEDYRERVVKEVQELLRSGVLRPDVELLNAQKVRQAQEQLAQWNLPPEDDLKLAQLCDLVTFSDGYFSFDQQEALDAYLEEVHHQLSAMDIEALLRFKTMMRLCWQHTHPEEVNFCPELQGNRRDILLQLLALIDHGHWLAPASADGIRLMIRKTLGVVEPLTGADYEGSQCLWRLLEQGKGDRVKVTFQNLIGYFISRKLLREGSPARNKDFFGSDEGYSNIDKGINESEMSQGFRSLLPFLDRFVPRAS